MTTGTLTRFGEGEAEGSINLLYKTMYVYEVDGKTYERPYVGDHPCNYASDEQFEEMLNHIYPVIYYRPDPLYSRMLITPEQFKKFGKESTKWKRSGQ